MHTVMYTRTTRNSRTIRGTQKLLLMKQGITSVHNIRTGVDGIQAQEIRADPLIIAAVLMRVQYAIPAYLRKISRTFRLVLKALL